MTNLSALLAVTLLATSVSSPASDKDPGSAMLRFVSESPLLVETAYGIDAIDSQTRWLDQRVESNVTPGQRTVWFTCPGAPTMERGSRITYTFDAGQRYELVCRDGQEPIIRKSGEC